MLLPGVFATHFMPPPKPRLVVVISIDQFRADYLDRFSQYFLPARSKGKVGGFRFLTEQGAWFKNAHYSHIPTATGPGHATILTGSVPSLTGIVGNSWFDRDRKATVYCASDPSTSTIGGQSDPMSAKNLLVSTVGDELKLATAGKAKVVAVALKDRASIFLAGHAADTVVWFDSKNGNWVTSLYYAPTGKLPSWVSAINDEQTPSKELDKTWVPKLPTSAYALTQLAPFVKAASDPVFSHSTKGTEKDPFRNWAASDLGQEHVFRAVKAAVHHERLGLDEVPDLLAVNLSTNDYVGHAYGPNSPEVMDITVRTDQLLSDFFNDLDRTIPGGLKAVTIAVSADHGVLPIVEEATKLRMPGARIDEDAMKARLNAALQAQFKASSLVMAIDWPHLYLDRVAAGSNLQAVEEAAAKAAMAEPGVKSALTGTNIMSGAVPRLPWADAAVRSFMPERCGDVVLFENPGTYVGLGFGTGHGSAWAYDTHVPILLQGAGIRKTTCYRRVSTTDIASTVSEILGIEQPTGNVGSPLAEALNGGR